jgi:helicase
MRYILLLDIRRQREIIEDEFRAGNLYMITATPSLMYGVNLPSKNVIIRDYTRWTSQGPQAIPVFDYEQMSGRAGARIMIRKDTPI